MDKDKIKYIVNVEGLTFVGEGKNPREAFNDFDKQVNNAYPLSKGERAAFMGRELGQKAQPHQIFPDEVEG